MKNKKTLAAVLALAILIGVGGTIAYFRYTESFDNKFELGKQEISFSETFDSPDNWTPCTETPKEYSVNNSSTFAIKARIKIQESWTSNAGTTAQSLPLTVDNNDMAIKNINTTKWIYDGTDGYYYYDGSIAAGATSENFINSVTFNCDATTDYSNAEYHLIITADTIQADVDWSHFND